jgi:hypothetical protein
MLLSLALLLLVFFLVIVGVILLLVKLCTGGHWVAAVVTVLLLLFAVAFVGVVSLRFDVPLTARRVHTATVPAEQSALTVPEQTGPSIWLPGIEDRFQADVYPSKRSAVRALGLRIDKPVRQVLEGRAPSKIIIFEGSHGLAPKGRNLLTEFGQALAGNFPETEWVVAPETAAVHEAEVGVRLDFTDLDRQPAPSPGPWRQLSGTVQATVLAGEKLAPEGRATAATRFAEKPWVEDFSGFLNAHPDAHFMLVRSTESCISEAQANSQAIHNACAHLTEVLVERLQRKPGPFARIRGEWPPLRVSSAELLEGDFIVDRFVQSFDGTAGKIWRQALLIDASPDKLKRLAVQKAAQADVAKRTWAGMLFSVGGLLVLIIAVYTFLNAATKGYYVWSLRIAGIVLALIGAVSIVMFLTNS